MPTKESGWTTRYRRCVTCRQPFTLLPTHRFETDQCVSCRLYTITNGPLPDPDAIEVRTERFSVVRSQGGWSPELLAHIEAGNTVVWR